MVWVYFLEKKICNFSYMNNKTFFFINGERELPHKDQQLSLSSFLFVPFPTLLPIWPIDLSTTKSMATTTDGSLPTPIYNHNVVFQLEKQIPFEVNIKP